MTMFRRSVLVGLATVALVALAVGVTLAVRPGDDVRDIVLTARGMSYYVSGDTQPNPPIRVRPGERVRFVLRNEAAGFAHDLSIPALDVAVDPIEAGESRAVEAQVPREPGTFEYVCRPHAQMMRGVLVVSDR